MARKPTDTVALQVRLPEGMRRKLASVAETNARSLNSEIVWRLGQSLGAEGGLLAEVQLDQEKRDQEFLDRIMNNPTSRAKLNKIIADFNAKKGSKGP